MENSLHLPLNDEDTPWLLYGHKQTQTLYSISPHTPKAYLRHIPQLRHKKILDYTRGWFVLRDRNQSTLFSLYNPVTLHLINLPSLPPAEHVEHMFVALKSPPDRDDCLFLLCNNDDSRLHWCSPAKPDCSWVTQPLEFDGERLKVRAAFTLHGGLFYVNVIPINIPRNESLYEVHVDVSNSLITFRPWVLVDLPYPSCIRKYLVESCGHVYFVCYFYLNPGTNLEPRAIEVFELDFSQLLWKQVDSLDGRSFFIGSNSCTWCWGTTNEPDQSISGQRGIQSNCVYIIIPAAEPGDRLSVYRYNLDDKSFMPLRSCPEIIRPKDPPVWLIPQHQGLSSAKGTIKKVVDYTYCQAVLQHDGGQQNRFTELPLRMIQCISKYMHLFEYWNFRASCKLFQSICHPPRWRTNNAFPLLMILKNNTSGSSSLYGPASRSCELIDPCRSDSRFNVLPLSPDPYTLKFSNNGWLLTYADETQPLEFFNVFTGARGRLQSLYSYSYYQFPRSIGFTTYPTHPDCITVAIDAPQGGRVLISSRRSKRHWSCQQFESQFYASNSSPVVLGGAFYFLDVQGFLGVFKGFRSSTPWRVYDKPQTIKQFHSCHLLECEGKLYSVFIEKVGEWIQIYRLDESVMSWVEVKCLGNHSFFVSRASSFSAFARDPRMRNRIYLSRFRGNKMIYYSLDSRKFHVLGCDEPLVDLYGISEPSNCCWI